ncbi:MAG: hypothetical protein HY812_15050 [Planctomycetes bacterium]|nr:hypothetical protein [Planctomycetota bacterium]
MWNVVLLAALAFPQVENSEGAAALPCIYDLTDLCAATSAVEARHLPSVEMLARVLREHVLARSGGEVDLAPGGYLLVRGSSAQHAAVEAFLRQAREPDQDEYGVLSVRGETPRGQYGEPAQAVRFVAVEGSGRLEVQARALGESPLEVVVLGAEEGSSGRIDLKDAALGDFSSIEGAPHRPLQRLVFSDARAVPDSWQEEPSGEADAAGFVPPFEAGVLPEGLAVSGVFLPLPAEAGKKPRVRLFLDMQIFTVVRPAAAGESESGETEKPSLTTQAVEATVTFDLGDGFAILLPYGEQEDIETLLAIWVNQTAAPGG